MTDAIVPVERIRNAIILIRGQKMILDRDLAELYDVPTKVLKQAIKRSADRFPEDFMFVLTQEEFMKWRSQFVTSISDRMGLRHTPMAFTAQADRIPGARKADEIRQMNAGGILDCRWRLD